MASAPLERLSDSGLQGGGEPGDAKREAEPKRGVMKGERCRAVPAGASDEPKILNITGRAGAGEGGLPMTGADGDGAKPMDRTVRCWLRQIIHSAVEPEMAGPDQPLHQLPDLLSAIRGYLRDYKLPSHRDPRLLRPAGPVRGQFALLNVIQ
jgi:hypothetical protein